MNSNFLSNTIKIIFLACIQGLTEFLPISSSGHLAILKHFLNFEVNNLMIEIFLHFGSLLAMFIFLGAEIKNLIFSKNYKMLFLIFIGILPAGIVGVLFKDFIELKLTNIKLIGFFYLFFSLFLLTTIIKKNNYFKELDFKSALIIGIIQIFALLPGISRSGSTIGAGILLNIEPLSAGKFSFYMAIPLIGGAFLKELLELNFLYSSINFFTLFIGIIVSFIVSYLTLKILFVILKKNKFGFFGFYCLILSLTILLKYY